MKKEETCYCAVEYDENHLPVRVMCEEHRAEEEKEHRAEEENEDHRCIFSPRILADEEGCLTE